MKRETFLKIAKSCVKGNCETKLCPHMNMGGKECRNALLKDAVSLIAADMAKVKEDPAQMTRADRDRIIRKIRGGAI